MDVRARRVANGFLLVFAGLFLSLTIRDVAGLGSLSGHLSNVIFPDLSFVVLAACIGSAYNKRVILHQDAIEVVGWFYSRKLTFVEIRGRQTTGSSKIAFPYAYVLVPSDKSKRKLVLPAHLHTDQFFRDWIKTIPKIPR